VLTDAMALGDANRIAAMMDMGKSTSPKPRLRCG
jgi:hypothetical protein